MPDEAALVGAYEICVNQHWTTQFATLTAAKVKIVGASQQAHGVGIMIINEDEVDDNINVEMITNCWNQNIATNNNAVIKIECGRKEWED